MALDFWNCALFQNCIKHRPTLSPAVLTSLKPADSNAATSAFFSASEHQTFISTVLPASMTFAAAFVAWLQFTSPHRNLLDIVVRARSTFTYQDRPIILHLCTDQHRLFPLDEAEPCNVATLSNSPRFFFSNRTKDIPRRILCYIA